MHDAIAQQSISSPPVSAAAAAAAASAAAAADTSPIVEQLASLDLVSSTTDLSPKATSAESSSSSKKAQEITYRSYRDEDDIPVIIDLIAPYLSEPYSIYCYRYFLHGWPQLCTLAYHGEEAVGVIVCKQDLHRGKLERGYIAMLSTKPSFRKFGIATTLVERAIETMRKQGAQEVVLETEVWNKAALRLYERMGFIRAKRLYRFYLNASDAFRLILPLEPPSSGATESERTQDDTDSDSDDPVIGRREGSETEDRIGAMYS